MMPFQKLIDDWFDEEYKRKNAEMRTLNNQRCIMLVEGENLEDLKQKLTNLSLETIKCSDNYCGLLEDKT